MQIFVKLQGRTRTLHFDDDEQGIRVSSLKQSIQDYEGIPCNEQRLVCSQRDLQDNDVILKDELCFVSVSLRVFGGKGGFGSLLRGAPSKIGQKKTDNFDACRDLNGRRLRHANNEKKMQEWIASEKEREMEKVAMQHIKKLANQHHFDDAKYTAESNDIRESFATSLEKGITEAKKTGLQLRKRPAEEEIPQKRRQAWTDDDDLFGAESEPETKEKKSKRAKEEHPLTPPSPSSSAITTTTTTTTTSSTMSVSSSSSSSSIEQSSVSTTTTTTTTATPTTTASLPSSSSSSSLVIPKEIDVSKYGSAKELEEAVGADGLKAELQRLGLLCGGTPADRAVRLFLLKTTPIEKLDKKHFQRKKK